MDSEKRESLQRDLSQLGVMGWRGVGLVTLDKMRSVTVTLLLRFPLLTYQSEAVVKF